MGEKQQSFSREYLIRNFDMDDDNAITDFDVQGFRRALGVFATGVTIITTVDPSDNQPVGVTVNSFNSLSLQPPLILWSLYKDSYSVGAFRESDSFLVNVLASSQALLSQKFSVGDPDKFRGVTYDTGIGGAAKLHGCSAYFECKKANIYEGGDHLIFIGEVKKFEATGQPALVFHNGAYAISNVHPDRN